MRDGTRANVKKLMDSKKLTQRQACRELGLKMRTCTSGVDNGGLVIKKSYVPPEVANPGNIIDCGCVGGGHLGSNIAHEGEAPFPEKLPDFFIRSFCKPGGVVLDPFAGTGTTIAAAIKTGRKFIGIDVRESQINLCKRRIRQAEINKGFML